MKKPSDLLSGMLRPGVFVNNIILFFLFFFFSGSICGQTTNISGIVNTYHKVVEIIPLKACVRVTNVSVLDENSRVMIVQMKGAAINTTNTSSFGDIVSLSNAGNYEIATICRIIGDSVFLFFNLLNTYDVSEKVQLVQFAEYVSANVIDTVKAAHWDSVAGTGGVIAIFAEEDITLNAPIYANANGYQGGKYVGCNGGCNTPFTIPFPNYFYNADLFNPRQEGAYKGESVVGNLASNQTGGKGAAASGGGGGNNHNNGGAGGANLTSGGDGGGNSSSIGCRGSMLSIGGKALSNNGGDKIYLGGGGGNGHRNNAFSPFNAGNGGGIVFIMANNLNSGIADDFNISKISANGGTGGLSISDGAGGGGAGGTIIMNVSNYNGNISIDSKGGNGGQSDNGGNIQRCYGAGGGGSGGAIYFSGGIPSVAISVTGGQLGAEINRDILCNAIQASSPGNDGLVFSDYAYKRSFDPAGFCLYMLPSKLISFNARLINNMLDLDWRVLHPELIKSFSIEKSNVNGVWVIVKNLDAEDSTENYSALNNKLVTGKNLFRLKIIEKTNSVYYSETRLVMSAGFDNIFTITPNPAKNKITIDGLINFPATLLIMDLSGKTVWQKRIFNNQVPLPDLLPGIYMVELDKTVKKLIIH